MEHYTYRGVTGIRASGVPLEYTAEQVSEIIKCSNDLHYFCNTYLKIITLNDGLQPFITRPYQDGLMNKIVDNRFLLCKMSRQSGKTVSVAAVLLWYALFNDVFNIAIMAHKQDQAIKILNIIKNYYTNLPDWLQLGLLTWNTKSIELENGSIIFAAGTSSGSIVGQAVNIVYSDEFDLIEPNLQELFFTTSFPTISSGSNTKFIITTTPRGFKYFHKLWVQSEKGENDFIRHEINYWDVPGRDAAWAEKEKKRIGEARFRSEYVTDFIGSSNTLVDSNKLKTLVYIKPITQDDQGYHQIFYHPEPGHIYVLVSDVSEGLEGDYSAFSVIDVTTLPYRVVCTYANNLITPMMYPNVIFDTAQYYNMAYVLIETNAIGAQVANILYYDLEYENILSTNVKSKDDDISETVGSYLGVKQTKKTKHIGSSNLKMLIENDQLMITDYRIFHEITRFVRKGSSWAAEKGEHDDLVMGLLTFAWLTTQPSFRNITGNDVRNALNQHLLNEQDMMPANMLRQPHTLKEDNRIKVVDDIDLWLLS